MPTLRFALEIFKHQTNVSMPYFQVSALLQIALQATVWCVKAAPKSYLFEREVCF